MHLAVKIFYINLALYAVCLEVFLLRAGCVHILPFALVVKIIEVRALYACHRHVLHVEVVFQVVVGAYARRVRGKTDAYSR